MDTPFWDSKYDNEKAFNHAHNPRRLESRHGRRMCCVGQIPAFPILFSLFRSHAKLICDSASQKVMDLVCNSIFKECQEVGDRWVPSLICRRFEVRIYRRNLFRSHPFGDILCSDCEQHLQVWKDCIAPIESDEDFQKQMLQMVRMCKKFHHRHRQHM